MCHYFQTTVPQFLLAPLISFGVLQARRTASVRSMHSLLRTPQGQAAGQAMLPILWPAVLQLLQDSQIDMRQTVAPVVGFLGALAARPGRPSGGCHYCSVFVSRKLVC